MDNENMKAVLAGIREIRDQIVASSDQTPRWVAIKLNELVLTFSDEVGRTKNEPT